MRVAGGEGLAGGGHLWYAELDTLLLHLPQVVKPVAEDIRVEHVPERPRDLP